MIDSIMHSDGSHFQNFSCRDLPMSPLAMTDDASHHHGVDDARPGIIYLGPPAGRRPFYI